MNSLVNAADLPTTCAARTEFSLETTLLRRWRANLFSCRVGHHEDISSKRCAHEADIVVIPSLYLHGTGFNQMNPWDDRESFMPIIDREKKHRAYWEKVKTSYARVEGGRGLTSPSSRNVTWPLIIVHYSYVFDASWNLGMLHALLEQPLAFQERVILGTIESNLHEEELQ